MRQFGLVVLLFAALPFSMLRAYAEDGPITPGEALRLFKGKDLSNFYTWLVDDKTRRISNCFPSERKYPSGDKQ